MFGINVADNSLLFGEILVGNPNPNQANDTDLIVKLSACLAEYTDDLSLSAIFHCMSVCKL